MGKNRKREVNLGNFAQIAFGALDRPWNISLGKWDKALEEMIPHLKAIIAINDAAGDEGFLITDLPGPDGKKPLCAASRVLLAQEKLLGVKGSKLKKGDLVWSPDDREESSIDCDPGLVSMVGKEGIVVTYGRDTEMYPFPYYKDKVFIRAPKDWQDNGNYQNFDYWLDMADEMGIK